MARAAVRLKRTPLHQQLLEVGPLKGAPVRPASADDDEARLTSLTALDAASSKKILAMAFEEQKSLEQEAAAAAAADGATDDDDKFEEVRPAFELGEENIAADERLFEDISLLLARRTAASEKKISLTVAEKKQPQTLGDAILEDVKAQEARRLAQGRPAAGRDPLPEQIVELFGQIASFMKRYKSGSLPKALKFLPKWERWEELLLLTEPEGWAPAAMREMTKIFMTANRFCCQRFLNLLLLPAVREDIARNKKLRVPYFDALRKSLYKADVWFKAILFPWLQNDCTMKEAVVLGAALMKSSIPPLVVAAGLIKLTTTYAAHRGWTTASCYIIGILYDKQSAIPAPAISAGVDYFDSFIQLEGVTQLPVIWHTTLLIFVQRYKLHLDATQRKCLTNLTRAFRHEAIRTEILRELNFAAT